MRQWKTPLGPFDIEVGAHGVSSVQMSDGRGSRPADPKLAAALNEHLHGRAGALQLDLQGLRPLAQVTLAKLLEIPFAEVRSYAWVAREIGRPAAVRAVASAVAGNPVPLLIPCHRVVRSDGHIGEFSLGGVHMKRRLLEFEGVDVEELESLARRRIRYIGDEHAQTFHLPSCHKAPPREATSRLELKSLDDAAGLSLHSCRRCRPVANEEPLGPGHHM